MESILTIKFTGRLRRSRFWSTYIVLCIISFVLLALVGAVGLAEGSSIASIMTGFGSLFFFYLTLVGLGLGARRLHDTGLSGWWQLIALIPYVGAIVLIVLFFRDGTPGSNQWGPNPKELA